MNETTIAFVDMAGFTALTEVHGDEAAATLVDDFVALCEAALDGRGRIVKSIGDAVMLAVPAQDDALHSVRRIFEACYERDGLPEPRAGLHHGPVVERGDDLFGATVNLAARVAGRATSGQVLVTDVVAEAAALLGIDVVDLGEQSLRNIGDPVRLWIAEVCPTHVDLSVDPVCRMRVGCQAAVGRIRYEGVEHSFCSLDCVRAFVAEPERFFTT